MQGLAWYDKVLFVINSLLSTALLFAYLLPYIPPKSFDLLSVLSLAVPPLIMINAVFLLYWLLRLKKQLILPLLVLLIGYNHVTSLYVFSRETAAEKGDNIITVLSYNVRQFNQFNWSDENNIPDQISNYVQEVDPDLVGFQEYFRGELEVANHFEYKAVQLKDQADEFGQAILSKYPILNYGSLNFPTHSSNNGIYADVAFPADTLRVINVHFQSFGIKPDIDKLETEYTKQVFKGMGQTFEVQQEQMELVKEVIEKSPYRVVLIGDFNNTPYSYIYRELRSMGLQDGHKVKGNGFGRTFAFEYFPLRIDYILPEESIEVLHFETVHREYSDHFPIHALLRL